MNCAIFTLYEKTYHLGVAALINSLVRVEFAGQIFVGYRDDLPPWCEQLQSQGEQSFKLNNCQIQFFKCTPDRHLGYHKPFTARELLEKYPDITALFYADPDITFIGPWKFFEKWVTCGVALCADSNFPTVPTHHPWRQEWSELIAAAGLKVVNNTEDYANSGFFGVHRNDVAFLDDWVALTEAFERQGGNTQTFTMSARTNGITGDQDIMAAATMTHPGRLSFIGQEAMGFNGHYFILAHAIESPKPWSRNFSLHALKGNRPSVASSFFLRNADSPIQTNPSDWASALRRADFAVGKLIGRFMGR
ncbi:MAG TPA: hypothetical protein VIS99_15530 [Terrimicrobiaceae bacterium]